MNFSFDPNVRRQYNSTHEKENLEPLIGIPSFSLSADRYNIDTRLAKVMHSQLQGTNTLITDKHQSIVSISRTDIEHIATVSDRQSVPETAAHNSHRIIRFGETESDVFMVTDQDLRRSELVAKLNEDPTSPERWLLLLKCPPSFEAKLYSQIRLYRRATNVIPKEKYRLNSNYAEIWVGFAKLKDNEKDARDLFKFMKSEKIGERHAGFYEAYAEFEALHGNEKEAASILSSAERMGVLSLNRKMDLLKQYRNAQSGKATIGKLENVAQTPVINNARDSVLIPSSVSTPFATQRESGRNVKSMSKLPREQQHSLRNSQNKSCTPPRPLLPFSSASKLSLGPARRVPSTEDDNQGIDDDEPEPEVDVNDLHKNRRKQYNLSPVVESARTAISSPLRQNTDRKPNTDFAYIKNWNPSRPLKRQERESISFSDSVTKTSPNRKRTIASTSRTDNPPPPPLSSAAKPTALITTAIEKKNSNLYSSPTLNRREHKIEADARKSSLSPGSATSSTPSSPPTALVDSSIPAATPDTDPFSALQHSRITVNGRPYIKLEQIGSGGSSKVYRILGPDLKIYALKKIKLKRLDALGMEQYHNEIELLKRLQGNPHIIKLVAADQDLNRRVIHVVMEHGEIDLSEKLQELKGSASLEENFLRITWMQMLQAVHAIHKERIIHGDLKPANFLFVNGALKLIDFGIAKAISNDTTNIVRDSQVGTVNFMSPESIQGNTPSYQHGRLANGKMKVGRASDIWSLGCILYQIVYGKPPFADVHSIIEKFRCIVDPLYEIRFDPLVNTNLENVVRSCLQRDHRHRPTIDGPNGLLNHPFLKCSAKSSTNISISKDNAANVLQQVEDFIIDQNQNDSPFRQEKIIHSVSYLKHELNRLARKDEPEREDKADHLNKQVNYDTIERRKEL